MDLVRSITHPRPHELRGGEPLILSLEGDEELAVNAGKKEMHTEKEVESILEKMCKNVDVIRGGPLIHADELLEDRRKTKSNSGLLSGAFERTPENAFSRVSSGSLEKKTGRLEKTLGRRGSGSVSGSGSAKGKGGKSRSGFKEGRGDEKKAGKNKRTLSDGEIEEPKKGSSSKQDAKRHVSGGRKGGKDDLKKVENKKPSLKDGEKEERKKPSPSQRDASKPRRRADDAQKDVIVPETTRQREAGPQNQIKPSNTASPTVAWVLTDTNTTQTSALPAAVGKSSATSPHTPKVPRTGSKPHSPEGEHSPEVEPAKRPSIRSATIRRTPVALPSVPVTVRRTPVSIPLRSVPAPTPLRSVPVPNPLRCVHAPYPLRSVPPPKPLRIVPAPSRLRSAPVALRSVPVALPGAPSAPSAPSGRHNSPSQAKDGPATGNVSLGKREAPSLASCPRVKKHKSLSSLKCEDPRPTPEAMDISKALSGNKDGASPRTSAIGNPERVTGLRSVPAAANGASNASGSAGGSFFTQDRNLQSYFEGFSTAKADCERIWNAKPLNKDLFESAAKVVVQANFDLALAQEEDLRSRADVLKRDEKAREKAKMEVYNNFMYLLHRVIPKVMDRLGEIDRTCNLPFYRIVSDKVKLRMFLLSLLYEEEEGRRVVDVRKKMDKQAATQAGSGGAGELTLTVSKEEFAVMQSCLKERQNLLYLYHSVIADDCGPQKPGSEFNLQ